MSPYQQTVEYLRTKVTRQMISPGPGAHRLILLYEYRVEFSKGEGHLSIPDNFAESLSILARSSRAAYDLAKDICSSYILRGDPLPDTLRTFALQVLSDTWPAPKKTTNPKGDELWSRDWHIIHFMSFLPEAFGLLPTRNESHGEYGASVADAISEVFSEVSGLVVSYEAVKKVWDDKRKRARFEFLNQSIVISQAPVPPAD